MNLFRSMLVPLDGSEAATQALRCARWLASRLDAEIHVLSAGMQQQPRGETLAGLKIPPDAQELVTLHQGRQDPLVEILSAIERYAIDLVVMTARGVGWESSQGNAERGAKPVGRVTEAVIEGSPVPVLLVPQNFKEDLAWESVLVPMSGEPGTDEALMLAIRLANLLDLKVHIVHVVDSESTETAMGCYCDQAHHEYPEMLNALISRACPLCTREETRCIEGFSLARGKVGAGILGAAREMGASLLVVGWHGRFGEGRAQILKHLCAGCTIPVLLFKPPEKPPFKLKVGSDLER